MMEEKTGRGYYILLKKIYFAEDSIKIVIHVCSSPGHGKSFTGKSNFISDYITILSFSPSNTYLQNKAIYDGIQYKQNGIFKRLINEISSKKVSFLCINGSEYSLQCFNRTRSLYITHDDCKFIVKNEFGYIFEPSSLLSNNRLNKLEKKLRNNIKSGINAIINYKKNGKVSELERDTEEENSISIMIIMNRCIIKNPSINQ